MKPTSASRTAASALAGLAAFATFAESRGQPRSAGLTGPTLILEDSVPGDVFAYECVPR